MHRLQLVQTITLVASCSVIFAGCGGGGSQSATVPPRSVAMTAGARLTITIPAKSTSASKTASAGMRSPAYISPATQSISINVTPQGSTTSVSGYPQTANLTPTSTGCSSTLAGTQCTINLAVPPGNYDLTVTTYDQTNAGGNVLSAAQAVPFVVNAGAANTVAVTLGGVATSLTIVPDQTSFTGTLTYGLVLAPSESGSVSVVGVDADGNFILGPGAPTVTLTSSDSTLVSVAAASSASPNRFVLTTVASGPAAAQLTASATPVSGSGGSALSANVYISSTAPVVMALNGQTGYVNEVKADGSLVDLSQTAFANTYGAIPTSMTFGAGGKVYQTATIYPTQPPPSATLAQFNTSGSELSFSPLSDIVNASAAVYDSHNQWLYLGGKDANNNPVVTAIDATGTQQTLSGFSGVPEFFGMTFDPQNDDLYLATLNGVLAYSESGTRQSIPAFASGSESVVYGPEHGWLYTINDGTGGTTGAMVAYDQNGVQQAATVTGLALPTNITYNPGSGLLYILNGGNSTLSIVTQDGVLLTSVPTNEAVTLGAIP